MNPLISLIIPVYNVEKYFGKCMRSVLVQTYENFEVLLVDDGSTDASGSMCDEFATMDTRVRVFHRSNRGVSSARNFGMEQSRGEYIAFIDADDYVTRDYLEYLYSLIQKYDAEISTANYWRIDEDSEIGRKAFVMSEGEEDMVSPEEAIKMTCYGAKLGTSPCAKLYQRELLLKHSYKMDKVYGEDVAIIFELISDSKRVAVGGKCIYWYVQHAGSAVHQSVNECTLQPLQTAAELLEYIRKNYPESEQAARVRGAIHVMDFIPQMLLGTNLNLEKRYFIQYRDYFRTNIRALISDQNISCSFKLRCIAVALGYWPTKSMWGIVSTVRSMMGKNK